MNGKYEVTPMAFSLETMCALTVAQQVLAAMDLGDLLHLRLEDAEALEKDAVSRTQTLELPREMMKKVESFIHPTIVELKSWEVWTTTLWTKERPIFKSCGTIDMVRSVNAIILSKKIDKCTRYIVACKSCFEDFLLDIHESKHPDLRLGMHIATDSKLATFWQKAFSGVFGKLVDGRHLPQNAYVSGLALAMEVGNDEVVKYFINKVSPETARECIYRNRNVFIGVGERCTRFFIAKRRYYGYHKMRFSPTIYQLLLSKMSEDQQRHCMPTYAFLILASLLDWPYQQFFMEAVNVFRRHLMDHDYWDIMGRIIVKIRYQARDYNYCQLFTKFWLLRSSDWRRFRLNDAQFWESVFDVLMIEDESLISFMFKEMTNEEKELLLMEFNRNKICGKLISENRFHQLQLFIRSCCMNRIDVLQKFKSEFLAKAYFVALKSRSSGPPSVQREKLNAGLQQFVNIVDGIAIEIRNLDAMEK